MGADMEAKTAPAKATVPPGAFRGGACPTGHPWQGAGAAAGCGWYQPSSRLPPAPPPPPTFLILPYALVLCAALH